MVGTGWAYCRLKFVVKCAHGGLGLFLGSRSRVGLGWI